MKPLPAPASRRALLRAGAGLGLSSLAPLAALATGNDSQVWPAGQSAPALRTTDVSGRPVQLADHRGKLLLLNFWASWCGPCRVEMPSLVRLPELFGEDRLVVVGLNVKEGPRAVSLFLQRTGVQMPVWMDPQGEITRLGRQRLPHHLHPGPPGPHAPAHPRGGGLERQRAAGLAGPLDGRLTIQGGR